MLGSGRNVSDAPCAFPEGGCAEGGLRGWLAFAACGAGFYSPKGCARLSLAGRFLLAGWLAEGVRWMALCCCYHVIPRGIGEKGRRRMGGREAQVVRIGAT